MRGRTPFFFHCFAVPQSEMAPDGHSSTQTPQSTHLDGSITAMSSTVMASWGHASAQFPQATQRLASTVGILSPCEPPGSADFKRNPRRCYLLKGPLPRTWKDPTRWRAWCWAAAGCAPATCWWRTAPPWRSAAGSARWSRTSAGWFSPGSSTATPTAPTTA